MSNQTLEEKRAVSLRYILEYQVQAAELATEAFLEDAEDNLLTALDWAEGKAVVVAVGAYAKQVLANVDADTTLLEAATAKSAELTRELVRNYEAGTSTSAYSNAVSASKRSARSQFVESLHFNS